MTHDVVLQSDRARLLVQALASQLERRAFGGGREQGNAPSKQHRNQRHLDAIDQAGGQQAPKQLTAAEQRDVLARFRTELGDHALGVGADRDVWVVARPNVRENTMFWVPGADLASFPIRIIASKVLRPIRNVSNCASIPAKSMSGSMTIQSYSPLGPAMYPSRLIAPPYRTSRMQCCLPRAAPAIRSMCVPRQRPR